MNIRRNLTLILAALTLVLSMQPLAAQDDDDKKSQIKLNKAYLYKQQNPELMRAVLDTSMINVQVANDRTKDEVKDKNGLGPKNQVLNLGELIRWRNLGAFGLELQSLLTYSLSVYPDANEASGIYYYLPTRYFIDWDRDNGYHLTIDFNPRTEESDKNVLIQARLTPGFRAEHYQLLKSLLQLYRTAQGLSSTQVQLYPLPANLTPRFELVGVPDSQKEVSLTGIDFDTRELGISIATTAEFSQVVLNNLTQNPGLRGDIAVEPEAVSSGQPALSGFPVQANLYLCDTQAYARKPWARASGDHSIFVNDHPLPVRLNHLLYIKPSGNGLQVRGFDLGRQRLVPGQRALIENSRINSEIDEPNTLAAWYAYSIECDDQALDTVVQAMTGGVGSTPVADLGIDILGGSALFEQYGVHKIIITVRSDYFDPEGDGAVERVYELTSDTTTADCGPLYLRDGTATEIGENLYSYRIGIISTTGEIFSDSGWRQPNPYVSLRTINIGAAQIEDLMAEDVQ